VDAVAAKLAELNTERKKLTADQAVAQREAASPLAESWGEFRSLADLLKKDASEELRVKARSALRRSIETVYCLFVRYGSTRVAAVQVNFTGTGSRSYLILHKAATAGAVGTRPAQTWVRSFATAGLPTIDLRRRDHADKLLRVLSDIRPDELAGG
jgi:hypothetical protein